ncbi:MarR family transcriptional regulator [Thiospirochaeta perfilievii]|uniref:MarR family transcriptional regulator n=1 Tax=Thiospirochaeta perfilievii TaxID=252967 RepID=A0A5C1QCE4_9SPIO|nr:MarR family transcriptional regulator [Thiospirochaeta perfilievii]QEN04334.1 MarR family transcriptional regulator [Thiospirochaeta perfilievii]
MNKLNRENLTIIDLISEQHLVLRKLVEDRWMEISNIEFSHTEWFLLSKTEQESLTISKAATLIGISRQAMQKCAKKLEERGYINFFYKKDNKRDKYIVLTETGRDCCNKNNNLKKRIENEIIENIGNVKVKDFKELLKKDWLK